MWTAAQLRALDRRGRDGGIGDAIASLSRLHPTSVEDHSGLWRAADPLASTLKLLAVLGESLSARYKVVPGSERPNARDRWNAFKAAAANHANLEPGVVEGAMYVLFPPSFEGATPATMQSVSAITRLSFGKSPCLVPRRGTRYTSVTPKGYVMLQLHRQFRMHAHRFVLLAVEGLPLNTDGYLNKHGPYYTALEDAGNNDDMWRKALRKLPAMHMCENKRCVNWLHVAWGDPKYNNNPINKARYKHDPAAKDDYYNKKLFSRKRDRIGGMVDPKWTQQQPAQQQQQPQHVQGVAIGQAANTQQQQQGA